MYCALASTVPLTSVNEGFLAMNRTTPVWELAPKVVPCGPFSTSMRSMSTSFKSGVWEPLSPVLL